ncbi:MAG: glycine zipper 2TM domain-containing protein [Candidatus Thioglobus sp.]|nr:glycine zipper 2TM domain-containing protein [Candidatus Thioglobus sp.]
MKIIVKSLVLMTLFLGTQLAFAGSFTDHATVTSVEKVYKQYRVEEPYQECYIKETLQNQGDGSATNELFGAVLGGAIGNQFGEGDGNDAMTLFGALMGASIANDMEKTNSTGQVVVSQEVCENKVRQRIEKRLSHYMIHVDYDGNDVSFTSKKRPYDDVIKVKVTISSLDD